MSHPTKFVKIVTPLAFAIALAACGGGGSAEFGGGSGGGGSPSIIASAIELSASSRQLPSDGSKPVVITAIAKDKNNNAISGTNIVFSVDNDATINTDIEGATASGSVKTANLTPGIPENRLLEVTATSGNQSKTITVEVVGTTVVIDGPRAITLAKDVPFVLKLKDSANEPIAYQAVDIKSLAGHFSTDDNNYQTDASGEIAFTLTGKSSGTDTLEVTVLGMVETEVITVSGDQFELSAANNANDEIKINKLQRIDVLWTNTGIPQKNKKIVISATRGLITNSVITTDSSGKASFSISSATAGQTVISATTQGGLSVSLKKEFIATTPAYLNTQANPSLLAPNGSSTIIAKVRDKDDNPVKNKTIDFRLNDTVNGVLSASTAVTNSLGRASVSYTAGNSSSAKDGVVIKTFIQGYSVAEDEVFLTVGGDALRIVLGHDQLVATDDIFYVKKFGVIVTDSAGNPIKDQAISFKITPTHYYKGFMQVVDTDGDGKGDAWTQYLTAPECVSEDFDNDGNLDAGEDLNNNGTLEPTHDATITNSGVTDDQGKIVVEVVYPKSRAWWSKQTISATTLVEGTEFVEYTDLILPLAAEDAQDVEAGVPNALSPYGLSDSCLNDSDTYDAPIASQVVNAVTKFPETVLKHDTWYTVQFVDALGNVVSGSNYTIDSSVVTINKDQYGNFKLTDKNIHIENSGFYITLSVNGDIVPLFYQDDAAVEIETPPPVESTDKDAPILTLNGDSEVTIDQGSTYTELSANAVDAVDGVVSVTIKGTVNTSKLGTYTLIYTAIDLAGNSVSTTRTVIVVKAGTIVDPNPDAVLGAVEYVGAEPQTILLQGMSAPGLQHTSEVTFLIKDSVGNPIANQDVAFALTSSVGGTRLTAVTGKTDSQGLAKAILQAGTVHTSVRVRATVTLGSKSLSSESSQIIISTGIADQNSLSISLSEHNPAAWNHNGKTVDVTMHASDRYNNPVPDGTTVSFYTELGQIEPSCQTAGGACTVTWTSSSPRDLGIAHGSYAHEGITTITASVIGEESFVDTNSDGIFNDGDIFDTNSDRGEAFEDYNKYYIINGNQNVYEAGLEPYLDYNNNGQRDPKDGKYTGLGCEHSTLCAGGDSLKDIFVSTTLVLAEDFQAIKVWNMDTVPPTLVYDSTSGNPQSETIKNDVRYAIEVFGVHNQQVPPVGTQINIESGQALIVNGSSATVPSTNNQSTDINNPIRSYTMTMLVKDNDPVQVGDNLVDLVEDGFININVDANGVTSPFVLQYENN